MEIQKYFYFRILNIIFNDNYFHNLLITSILILMNLFVLFIFVSYSCKIFRIKKKKIYNLFLHHNFTFVALICPWIYWLTFNKIRFIIFYELNEYADIFNIPFTFYISVIFELIIFSMQVKLIIEIFFDLLMFYIKKLFGFDQEINYFECHFVGLKNEPKALLYHMLNYLRKVIYLIPIYLIFISTFIFEVYKVNVVYVCVLVIISLIEVVWLVYICKVYPYDSLSHNRIIIVNQISVVLILTLGVITTIFINIDSLLPYFDIIEYIQIFTLMPVGYLLFVFHFIYVKCCCERHRGIRRLPFLRIKNPNKIFASRNDSMTSYMPIEPMIQKQIN